VKETCVFQLPDFTRRVWRSLAEQDWWSAKIARLARAWQEIERESVALGVRRAAYQTVDPLALPDLTGWAVHNGLAILPTRRIPAVSSYVTADTEPAVNQAWHYRVVLARPDVAGAILEAIDQGNDEVLGDLLGYPRCCRDAYAATWGRGQVDSTWETFQSQANGPAETNTFLRWLGVRLVPHLPCSPTCTASIDLARQLAAVGRAVRCGAAVDDAYEMLAWPTAWSRIHGLTEVTMPAVKFITRSDYTPTLQRLTREGVYQPVESARWTDNGFKTAGGMLAVHARFLNTCRFDLKPSDRVLDLGAGNGLLLADLRRYLGIVPAGVERKQITPVEPMDWFQGDLADTPTALFNADAVLLMPGRLTELPPESAAPIREACLRVKTLIVYGYGDNLARAKGLGPLTTAAGLPDPAILWQDQEIAVGIIRNDGR
jgi:hypothetical protein